MLSDLQKRHLMENTRAIQQPGAPTSGVPGSMEFADEGRTLDYENEADNIVKQLLGRDQGTTDKINASLKTGASSPAAPIRRLFRRARRVSSKRGGA